MLKQAVFIILSAFCGMPCQASLYEANSTLELRHYLSQADSNTLIVFDVDYTLIMPENPAFHRQNSMDPFQNHFY